MQCFTSVQYLKGGVASGFTHVTRGVYETRLLHVKGSKSVRVNQVELSHRTLNAGDVFLLDQGLTILQWNGAEANSKEKAKALEVSTANLGQCAWTYKFMVANWPACCIPASVCHPHCLIF